MLAGRASSPTLFDGDQGHLSPGDTPQPRDFGRANWEGSTWQVWSTRCHVSEKRLREASSDAPSLCEGDKTVPDSLATTAGFACLGVGRF